MDKELMNELGQMVIFNTEDGEIHVQVDAVNETIWLNQKAIAELFGKSTSTINEHIKNIYVDEELSESSTMRKFGNSEFSTKPTNFYNLDVIIYDPKSEESIKFFKIVQKTAKWTPFSTNLRHKNID